MAKRTESEMMEMSLRSIRSHARASVGAMAMLAVVAGLAACSTGGISETTYHGYVASETALEQVPVGSSRDQVLIALGSPSTTADFGGEVFYYISQTRRRPVAFMPDKVVDQRVLAIYFNEDQTVEQIADYGLKDGKVFDFVTETTPTRGHDDKFLQQVLTGSLGVGNPFGR
jgi:outer membrane protein assembly factor BamE (lipoprotein component of BamABCDE complex)